MAVVVIRIGDKVAFLRPYRVPIHAVRLFLRGFFSILTMALDNPKIPNTAAYGCSDRYSSHVCQSIQDTALRRRTSGEIFGTRDVYQLLILLQLCGIVLASLLFVQVSAGWAIHHIYQELYGKPKRTRTQRPFVSHFISCECTRKLTFNTDKCLSHSIRRDSVCRWTMADLYWYRASRTCLS